MGGPLGNNPPTPSYGGAGLAGCVAAGSLVLLGPRDSRTWALPEDGRTETASSWGLGPPSQWVHTQGVGTELLQAPAAVFAGSLLVSCAFTISPGRPAPATARAVEDPDPGLS